MPEPLLKVENVHTFYGPLHVLKGVNYDLYDGEIVCLLGGNASGKSTTMKTILGLVRPGHGTIRYAGETINDLSTAERVRRGIAPVPEARRLFPRMTVRENLEMGAFTRRGADGYADRLERVFTLFPRLKERRRQKAGTFSGGEQQMLAIARGLMTDPEILIIDELSLGLAPLFVYQLFAALKALKDSGLTVLLVEQNVHLAFAVCDYAYVIAEGRLFSEGLPATLAAMPEIRRAYLGL